MTTKPECIQVKLRLAYNNNRKIKILVPSTFTGFDWLIYVIRNRHIFGPGTLFFYHNNVLISNNISMDELYERFYDNKGSLYLNVEREYVMG